MCLKYSGKKNVMSLLSKEDGAAYSVLHGINVYNVCFHTVILVEN